MRHLVVKARIGWMFPPGPRLVRQPQAFSGGKTVYSSGLGRRKPRHSCLTWAPRGRHWALQAPPILLDGWSLFLPRKSGCS